MNLQQLQHLLIDLSSILPSSPSRCSVYPLMYHPSNGQTSPRMRVGCFPEMAKHQKRMKEAMKCREDESIGELFGTSSWYVSGVASLQIGMNKI